MEKRQGLPVLNLTPQCLMGIAMGILLLPIPWVLAWCIVVFMHEMGHYLALMALKVKVYSVSVSLSGVKMQTESMSYKREILCSLAGPIASMLPLLTASVFPRMAICGLLLSMYNFLPIYPMDGGRAMKALLLYGFRGDKASKLYNCLENVSVIAVITLCVFIGVRISAGIHACIIALLLLIRSGKIKTPCKHAPKKVQ